MENKITYDEFMNLVTECMKNYANYVQGGYKDMNLYRMYLDGFENICMISAKNFPLAKIN